MRSGSKARITPAGGTTVPAAAPVTVLAAVLAAVAPPLLVMGCGGSDGWQPPSQSPVSEVRVFAASSLTEAMQDLAQAFEARHPDTQVRLTFAGSQILRLQLEQGAAADVFFSANAGHMDALAGGGVIDGYEAFAENSLALIVPAGSTGPVQRFADLPLARRIVTGTPNVPVGAYTLALIDRAGVRYGSGFADAIRKHVVSQESNVRLVRAKVELGEADAAFVYATDALSSSRVRSIPIPPDVNVTVRYYLGAVEAAPNPTGRDSLIAWVRSEGPAILSRHGFTPPSTQVEDSQVEDPR
ncbi:MAG: molybdate ABC transporter substrate-binding protein [Gemmatimonadota bacterium]|nr:molybdate ABC transporter substrate-binding protein [Gemmatimonadota bacterium]